MKKLLVALILMLTLGCMQQITHGEVCDRKFVAAHDERRTHYNMLTERWEKKTFHIPDAWSVTYRLMDEKSNEWRYRTITVSQADYEKFDVGSIIHYE